MNVLRHDHVTHRKNPQQSRTSSSWLILQYEDHAPVIKPHRSECAQYVCPEKTSGTMREMEISNERGQADVSTIKFPIHVYRISMRATDYR